MITTNIVEREKKIRAKLRIKEVITRSGNTCFYPQHKLLGIWFYFIDWYDDGWIVEFHRLEGARAFIDNYVDEKLNERKVRYHSVNYITH